jgi:predicted amidohydrolase YtcJ
VKPLRIANPAWLLALIAAVVSAQSRTRREVPDARAEVMYYNGKIITLWDKVPVAEAVTIAEGRIVAVGTTQEVGRTTGPQTKQIDLQGKTMVPGLIDSHVHPIGAALAERDAEIPIMHSFAEIRAHVEKHVASTPADALVFVPKVYSTRLNERRYPTRQEIDEYSGKHVVVLDNGYASALNSAALRAAGISRETSEPENGKIIRDTKTGEPTGLILGARQLVAPLLSDRRFNDEDRLWALREMQKAYNAAGITSVTDGAQTPDGLRTYQELWRRGEMTVRTTVNIRVNSEAGSPTATGRS